MVLSNPQKMDMTFTPFDSLNYLQTTDRELLYNGTPKHLDRYGQSCRFRNSRAYDMFLGTLKYNAWPIAHLEEVILESIVDAWNEGRPANVPRNYFIRSENISEVQIYSMIKFRDDERFIVGPEEWKISLQYVW